MKIFNWVHRKLNHNILKDGFARNVKKTESIAIDTNTKALLEQVALVDVLDGWRDGILKIGTFGFDPLKPVDEQKEFFIFGSDRDEDGKEGEHDSVNHDDEDDDHDHDHEDEEVNPLIFTTFEHNFEDVASNADENVGRTDVIITLDGVQLTPFIGSPNELRFDIDTTDNDQGKKRRRTTLADLFYEDSDIKKKPILDQGFELTAGKKQSVLAKNGLSFAKKLIPHVKEDSRPIKKLHQMMRMMLKRKIHPELEGKTNKSDGRNKASVLELLGKKHEAGESVSLLPIPDN
ncbi:NAD-dependent protein deacetylase HST1-like protein [Melia azedarach]|uniref:NAD-dependent protein deacetylase HST1-like protein n=1 Tax=Melia azedarach TaxID=155640 RepID=A0ACC1YWG9_MELAZ|nr:NAD-dependent protein deacetylase HST1-like protein [Melia azedarach]